MRTIRLLLAVSLAALALPPAGAHGGSATWYEPVCGAGTADLSGGCVADVRFSWAHPVCAVVDGSYDCVVAFTASGVIVGEACVGFGLATEWGADVVHDDAFACAGDVTRTLAAATLVDVAGGVTFRGLPLEGGEISWGTGVCLYAGASRTAAAPADHPLSCAVSTLGGSATIPPA